MKNKTIAVFNPYLDVLGGGERHILSILQVFEESGYQIDLLWDDKSIKEKLSNMLNISFSNLKIRKNFLHSKNLLSKQFKLSKYDRLFYVTDGSYFFSNARRNYVFCMYPKLELFNMTPITKLKLNNWSFIANSHFTAEFIKHWTGRKVSVVYPYIDKKFFIKEKKAKHSILMVGRFFDHLHSKRHDIVINAFIELKKNHVDMEDFKLIIAGGLKEGEDESYFKKLKKLAEDRHDINFVINPDFESLVKLYHEAMFYWHATGFGIDQGKFPERTEHLGLTPLEAMASQCVVFAHNSGGPAETIEDEDTGFLYSSIQKLEEKTHELFIDKDARLKIAQAGADYVDETFSYATFKDNIKKVFRI